MLCRIQPFLDAYRLEIAFPQGLEQLFIFRQQAFVQDSGLQMLLAGIGERDFSHRLAVVIESVFAPYVVNQPPLVGEPVTKMCDGQRVTL